MLAEPTPLRILGQQDPGHVAGIHLVPPLAGPDPAAAGDLTEAERETLASLQRTSATGVNRPGTAISPPLSSRNYS